MANSNPWTGKLPPLIRDSEKYRKTNSMAGHRFEKHQYARAGYTIREDGRVKVRSKFTNNKKFDGDHFTAMYVFRNRGGKVVFWTAHAAGMDGEALGGPGDRYIQTTGRIAPELIPELASCTVKWGRPNYRDDKAIGEKIIAAVLEWLLSSGDDETEEELKAKQLGNRIEPTELLETGLAV